MAENVDREPVLQQLPADDGAEVKPEIIDEAA